MSQSERNFCSTFGQQCHEWNEVKNVVIIEFTYRKLRRSRKKSQPEGLYLNASFIFQNEAGRIVLLSILHNRQIS